MKQTVDTVTQDKIPNIMDIDLQTIESLTLSRLIDEVRNEDVSLSGRYDRTHNRHNR